MCDNSGNVHDVQFYLVCTEDEVKKKDLFPGDTGSYQNIWNGMLKKGQRHYKRVRISTVTPSNEPKKKRDSIIPDPSKEVNEEKKSTPLPSTTYMAPNFSVKGQSVATRPFNEAPPPPPGSWNGGLLAPPMPPTATYSMPQPTTYYMPPPTTSYMTPNVHANWQGTRLANVTPSALPTVQPGVGWTTQYLQNGAPVFVPNSHVLVPKSDLFEMEKKCKFHDALKSMLGRSKNCSTEETQAMLGGFAAKQKSLSAVNQERLGVLNRCALFKELEPFWRSWVLRCHRGSPRKPLEVRRHRQERFATGRMQWNRRMP